MHVATDIGPGPSDIGTDIGRHTLNIGSDIGRRVTDVAPETVSGLPPPPLVVWFAWAASVVRIPSETASRFPPLGGGLLGLQGVFALPYTHR